MSTFFIADTHFGHWKIVLHCKRPFSSIEDHDETLIANWNAVVPDDPKAIVYHLGDFAFAKKPRVLELLDRLHGTIYLLRGNHERSMRGKEIFDRLGFIRDYFELKIRDEETGAKQLIVLCHYPFQTWNKRIHRSWHLHGHSHGRLPSGADMARMDVGVDARNFYPTSYSAVEEVMTRKVFKPPYLGDSRYCKEEQCSSAAIVEPQE